MDSAFNLLQKSNEDRRRSTATTVCSSNSSCILKRRRAANPLATPLRSTVNSKNNNTTRQRVLSAKLLKLKSIQNQLNHANFHLSEVTKENQTLRALQKRQDKALSKYEGTNADLPRILHAHEEEIRVMTERNKALRRNVRELTEQLKLKDGELTILQEQVKHYEKIDNDKQLLEREKLTEKVEDLQYRLEKADAEINRLNRKLTLEIKCSKQNLNNEILKNKQCKKELTQALSQVDKLTAMLENWEKLSNSSSRRKLPIVHELLLNKQSASTTSLMDNKSNLVTQNMENELKMNEKKLDVMYCKSGILSKEKRNCAVLRCPTENIKARLVADAAKAIEDDSLLKNLDRISLNDGSSDVGGEESSDGNEGSNRTYSRPISTESQKLEKLCVSIENAKKKMALEKGTDKFKKTFSDYCTQAMDSLKNYEDIMQVHKENFNEIREETENLQKSFKETESLELKLKHSHINSFNDSSNEKECVEDMDIVNEILANEASFQKKCKDKSLNNNKFDQNGNLNGKNSLGIVLEDRKKLLATLKAIDNGDSVDSVDTFEEHSQGNQGKTKLMQELFGNVAN